MGIEVESVKIGGWGERAFDKCQKKMVVFCFKKAYPLKFEVEVIESVVVWFKPATGATMQL